MASAHPSMTQPALVQPGGAGYAAPAAAPSADPFAGVPERDTIAVGSAAADDTDGIGGLFASAEPVDPPAPDLPPVPPAGPRTAVLDQPQWGAAPAAQQWNAPPSSPPWAATAPAPTWGTPPEAAPAPPSSGSPGKRGLLLVAAALLVLVLLGVGGFLLLNGSSHHGSTATASSSARASQTAAPTLAAGHTQQIDGVSFTLADARADTTCVGHSYGQVAGFFAGQNCTGLSRALYTAQVGGHAMVVAISKVRMPDATSARALLAMTDRSGTGNVSDLLREGVRFPGGPAALVNSEYASDPNGAEVTIVETSWIDRASAGTAEQLDSAASSGLGLDVPAFPEN
jgi:hypothetical protein